MDTGIILVLQVRKPQSREWEPCLVSHNSETVEPCSARLQILSLQMHHLSVLWAEDLSEARPWP